MLRRIASLLVAVGFLATAPVHAESLLDNLHAEYDSLGLVLQVLDNGCPICPAGSSSKYLSLAQTTLDAEIFTDDKDVTATLKGKTYLVTGCIKQTKLGAVIVVEDMELCASSVEMPGSDERVDYTLPEDGVMTNFYLTYTGSTYDIGGTLTPLFYLGVEEDLVESLLEEE